MIKINKLNKYYNKGKVNELHVINNTTITLPDSGLICILGESGSGKTTLMNTVSGLDDFVDGSIEVDGVEIKKYGDKNQEKIRNEKFGYIFQNYYLLMDRTVEYNILLALSMYDISEEEKQERIEYVLKAVDMWRYKKRLVSQLSGGQQQRIAIARALAKSPRVIFADEPTGNLDEANTMNIMGILKKISKKCLVVVVTHEKAIADFFADRILWISDGEIEREEEKDCHSVYQYIDDNNLYLKEFSKKEISNKNVALEIYNQKENQNITLQIVYSDGKFYLSAGDGKNVEFLTSSSEKKIIDSKRPVVELNDVSDIEFELEPIEAAKKPKISTREILDIAMANRKAMGKKQAFLIVTLLIIAVMVVISVQEICSALYVDRESIVNVDSHYFRVNTEKKDMITYDRYSKSYAGLVKILDEAGIDTCIIPNTTLIYQYSGFHQLENYEFEMPQFSFVSVEQLKEKDLIYGRMPENALEVVLDSWAVEKFTDSSRQVNSIITDVSQVIGNKITTRQGYELTIVGVSDTEQPDIYAEKELFTMLSGTNAKFMTEETLQLLYEDYEPGGLGLNEDGLIEVLVPESDLKQEYADYLKTEYYELINAYREVEWCQEQMSRMEREGDSVNRAYAKKELETQKKRLAEAEEEYGITYEEYLNMAESDTAYKTFTYEDKLAGSVACIVTGYFSEDMDVDYIVPEEALDQINQTMMSSYQKAYVYMDTENVEEAQKQLEQIIGDSHAEVNLKVELVNEADEAVQLYKEENHEKFGGRILITITIFVISMVILYFMMKANAIARMQDLGVYRMLGISKGNIIAMFGLEIFVISCYTSLVGVLGTTFVTFGLAGIDLLEMQVTYPWYVVLLTVVFLFTANIMVGILPIKKMLKLPPAQLAAKYDI
ncbi:MAG: ABC transporter ATP-binding protein/permease [Lachnospiraceae bacterium]|nr:ABC transporter ATP-binding protein/permease [Lachnospiraceae bacterium]